MADAKAKSGAPSGAGPKTTGGKPGASRRERLASFEAARKKEQRVRAIRLLIICVVLAALLLAYPVYLFAQDYTARNAVPTDFGVPAASAACDAIAEHAATGNQQHVDEGTKVDYSDYPPDSGKHYPTPAPFGKRFYTTADRPAVSTLVHNLEHGYTVVWYRSTLGSKDVKTLQSIAKTFGKDDNNPANKFIAAPWVDGTDGGTLAAGKNVVLTRWYADPNDPADTTKQKGVRQACGAISGAVIADFMAKYPNSASPEPAGA
jgi:hypothetical protein